MRAAHVWWVTRARHRCRCRNTRLARSCCAWRGPERGAIGVGGVAACSLSHECGWGMRGVGGHTGCCVKSAAGKAWRRRWRCACVHARACVCNNCAIAHMLSCNKKYQVRESRVRVDLWLWSPHSLNILKLNYVVLKIEMVYCRCRANFDRYRQPTSSPTGTAIFTAHRIFSALWACASLVYPVTRDRLSRPLLLDR